MNSIRILLVDDNVSARALLAAFVEQTPGLELCGEAGDGWQGLELTGRLRRDLVLLDLIMPGLDGIGFLEGLAGLSGGWRPRVIVLSGVSTDAYVQHSCRLGADYYLVKPVDAGQLRTVLERYLKKTARKKPWKSGSAEIMSDFPRSPSSIWKARATARTSTRPAACFIPACPQACWSRSWERIF